MPRVRLRATALAACTAGSLILATASPVAATTTTTTAALINDSIISPMMPTGGVFSTGTAWKLDVRDAPTHVNSTGMVQTLVDQTSSLYSGVAAFNAYQYSTSVYTVDANEPRVDVQWNNCQNKSKTPSGLLGEGGQFGQVPIPADAVPAKGTDAQLTIYSPETDQLWEFWVAKKVGESWTACWGGRIDDVSKSEGYFPGSFGASASGLALTGGTIGIRDVQSGSIEHAVALHMLAPGMASEFSYPAQRSDGFDTSANRVPEGTRFRLDPTIDVDSLRLTPIAKMVAKAAQKYGFIVTDRAGCTAVVAESPAAAIAATGVDPWTSLMAGTPSYNIMKNFPWNKLQALPTDYGMPATPTPTPMPTPTPTPTPTPIPTPTLKPTNASDTAYRSVRNGWGPMEKDSSNGEKGAGDGGPLQIAGATYSKGFGVHASSEIVVPLNGARTFTAKVGIDSEVGTRGSVVFQLWSGDAKLADSGRVRGGQPAKTLAVNVEGLSELRLVVTDSGDGSSGDHADWASPTLTY